MPYSSVHGGWQLARDSHQTVRYAVPTLLYTLLCTRGHSSSIQ